MDPNAGAGWFPGIERVQRVGRIDILLGRNEPVRLTLISETWTPRLDGLSFTAGCAMVQISGYLNFRTVITGTDGSGALGTACEVCIHMESAGTAEGRLALARARTILRDDLNRMAAELNPR